MFWGARSQECTGTAPVTYDRVGILMQFTQRPAQGRGLCMDQPNRQRTWAGIVGTRHGTT